MCGITLFVHRTRAPIDETVLKRATQTLSHRGPDGQRIEVHGHIGLGHTRLGIVDIIGGQQPIWNEDGTIGVICNGEIYNYLELRKWLEERGHKFSTNSDCEVIVHLYEEEGNSHIDRLIGMFSYVVYDKRKDVVYMARDRMGIKPLFLYIDRDHLLAASEIKALLCHPAIRPSLNGQVIYDFLTFGYTMGTQTAFEGINCLPEGHYCIYDGRTDSIAFSSYWQPSFPRKDEYSTDNVIEESGRFLELFTKVTQDHTMGDVPSSVFMSGGIDSTAIAAILGKSGYDLQTFSLQFADPRFDESFYYSKVTERSGLRSSILPCNDSTIEELEHAIYHLEQPQIVTLDVANIRLSKFTRQHNYKVAMAGDGADEQLGGYDHFGSIELLRDTERDHLPAFQHDKALFDGLAMLGFQEDFRTAFVDEMRNSSSIRDRFGTIPPWYMIWQLNDVIKRPLFRDKWQDTLGPDSTISKICRPLHDEFKEIDDLNKSVYLELKTRLPGWILWKSDRNSMANSVEVRVPYLDARVVDFFAKLHPKVKSTFLNEKAILRSAFKDILPAEIVNRRKHAFNTPMAWLFDDPPPRVLDLLSESALRRSDYFSFKPVNKLFDEVRNPANRDLLTHSLKTQTLIGVLTTQILHEQFIA